MKIITKTCECNIQRFSSVVKLKNIIKKWEEFLHFLIVLLKTFIAGTRWNLLDNRLVKAVLTSTHNLCFGLEIRKLGIPLQTPVLIYKSVV